MDCLTQQGAKGAIFTKSPCARDTSPRLHLQATDSIVDWKACPENEPPWPEQSCQKYADDVICLSIVAPTETQVNDILQEFAIRLLGTWLMLLCDLFRKNTTFAELLVYV